MSQSQLPRGFKSKAEGISLDLRRKLGLKETDACPARRAAGLYGAMVTSFQDVAKILSLVIEFSPTTSNSNNLLDCLTGEGNSISGLYFSKGEFKIILYNAEHSVLRQESSIMHELAHLILEHPGNCLDLNNDFALRDYNLKYEQEANWLGATLQIPQKGILKMAMQDKSKAEIAQYFRASQDMVNFRWNILGIGKILQNKLEKEKRTKL